LTSSLISRLQRSRIVLRQVTTNVHTTLAGNDADRLRVHGIRVDINVDPLNKQDRERMKQCLEFFEDFCVVTQSVRKGINVEVAVKT